MTTTGRVAFSLGLAGVALAMAGCHVGATVAIDVHADGGGMMSATVVLDKAAAAAVPDLGSQLQVDDLRQSGWKVTGPTPVSGSGANTGGVEVVASKTFADPTEAMADAGELAGPAGPVRDLVIRRHQSLLSTRTEVSWQGDLSARLEVFADDALRARMGGSAFGVDEAALAAQAGQPVDQMLSFRVSVRVPGRGPTSVDVPLGATRRVSAASTVRHLRLLLEATSAAAALIAAAVLITLRRRANRARFTIGGGRRRRDRWSVRGR